MTQKLTPEIRFGVLRPMGKTPEQRHRFVEKWMKARTNLRRRFLVGCLLKSGAMFVGYLASSDPPLRILNGAGEPIEAKGEPGDVVVTLEQLGQCEIVSTPNDVGAAAGRG